MLDCRETWRIGCADMVRLASTTSASSATSRTSLSPRTSRERSSVCASSRLWTTCQSMSAATRPSWTAQRRTRASTSSADSSEPVWRWRTTTRRSEELTADTIVETRVAHVCGHLRLHKMGIGLFTVHDIDEIYRTAAWAGAGIRGREPSNCARGMSIELATGVGTR